jgi:hypothetical protein
MRNRLFLSWIALLVLLVAGLACNLPGWEEEREQFDLPTPAPTTAPTSAPEQSEGAVATPAEAADGYPLVFQITGHKTSYGPSAGAACDAEEVMRLTLRGDGTAELVSIGPGFDDHINCVATSSNEAWMIEGKVDEVSQSVNFESCNSGGFSASGKVTYGSGAPAGMVFCTNKNGDLAVTLVVGP